MATKLKPKSAPSTKRAVAKNGAQAAELFSPVKGSDPVEVRELREWAGNLPDSAARAFNAAENRLLSEFAYGTSIASLEPHCDADTNLSLLRSLRARLATLLEQGWHTLAAERVVPGQTSADSDVIEVLVNCCQAHPLNIAPTAEEVATIQASLAVDGQLEPIDVRRLPDGNWQILSGHTRVLAAKKIKWQHLQARVHECDDGRALELLVRYNAKRRELNAIYKATMIQRLVDGGKTLAQAGAEYGLKDAGSACNFTRLLKLPQQWQTRVASGELPPSFARLLVPYVDAPRIMAAFDKDYQDEQKEKAKAKPSEHRHRDWAWESKVALGRRLTRIVDDIVRPIEKGHKRWWDECPKGVQDSWNYRRDVGCLFALTPDIEAKLDIVTITIEGDQKRRVATNSALYDKLQWPEVKALVDKESKLRAAKAGGKADAGSKKPLTAAQEKKRQAERAEQLAERVKAWRLKLLRWELCRAINDRTDNGVRLVLAVMVDRPREIDFGDLLYAVRGVKEDRWDVNDWDVVAPIVDDVVDSTFGKLAIAMLCVEPRDPRQRILDDELIEGYAIDLEVDVEQAWLAIQPTHPNNAGKPHALFEEFFLLHGKEPLIALGEELGVDVSQAKNRAVMVTQLTTRARALPLPKSIAPLATKAKPKAKATKKAKR